LSPLPHVLLRPSPPRPSPVLFIVPATNFWLDADLDLAGLAPLFWPSSSLPQNLPRIALTVIGDGENVRTRAQLDFAKPLPYREEIGRATSELQSPDHRVCRLL